MRGKNSLDSVPPCLFCGQFRDEVEHLVQCQVFSELGAQHLGLRFESITVECALLFEYDSKVDLVARALHLYAIFGTRFGSGPSVDRIYVERCRKALTLHPKLNRTICLV